MACWRRRSRPRSLLCRPIASRENHLRRHAGTGRSVRRGLKTPPHINRDELRAQVRQGAEIRISHLPFPIRPSSFSGLAVINFEQAASVDDDRSDHSWMNRAVVRKCSRALERKRELSAWCEYSRVPPGRIRCRRVGNRIGIRPSDRRANRDVQLVWRKGSIP